MSAALPCMSWGRHDTDTLSPLLELFMLRISRLPMEFKHKGSVIKKKKTRWRRVKTLGQHQVGVNLQSHAQHKLWISTWHIFCEFQKNNAMLKLSWKFGESNWNPYYWVIVLTSSDTNYVSNEHERVDQYCSFAIPSKLMLYQSHPESSENQNEILIELSCPRTHPALIKSLTNMKMLTNMTHMQ